MKKIIPQQVILTCNLCGLDRDPRSDTWTSLEGVKHTYAPDGGCKRKYRLDICAGCIEELEDGMKHPAEGDLA